MSDFERDSHKYHWLEDWGGPNPLPPCWFVLMVILLAVLLPLLYIASLVIFEWLFL